MGAVGEFQITDLLKRAGARLVGRNRADCPQCGRKRTVSYDSAKGVYCCHHQGCDFSGGAYSLAKRLALAQSLTPGERRAWKLKRECAEAAARRLFERIQARRLELYEVHRSLSRILDGAHARVKREPELEAAWSALALVYEQLPRVRAELLLLESAPIPVRLAFLEAMEEECRKKVEEVIMAGGLLSATGKFLELEREWLASWQPAPGDRLQ